MMNLFRVEFLIKKAALKWYELYAGTFKILHVAIIITLTGFRIPAYATFWFQCIN